MNYFDNTVMFVMFPFQHSFIWLIEEYSSSATAMWRHQAQFGDFSSVLAQFSHVILTNKFINFFFITNVFITNAVE